VGSVSCQGHGAVPVIPWFGGPVRQSVVPADGVVGHGEHGLFPGVSVSGRTLFHVG
jgi:hypothetical protein